MKQRIIVIDETSTAKEMINETLTESGYDVVAQLRPGSDLLSKVEEFSPDLLVINLKKPEMDFLHQIKCVNHLNPMPVVMFTQTDSQGMFDEVINSGVSAYVVDGLNCAYYNTKTRNS